MVCSLRRTEAGASHFFGLCTDRWHECGSDKGWPGGVKTYENFADFIYGWSQRGGEYDDEGGHFTAEGNASNTEEEVEENSRSNLVKCAPPPRMNGWLDGLVLSREYSADRPGNNVCKTFI